MRTQLANRIAIGALFAIGFLQPCAAALVTLDFQGVTTQPQQFSPGVAPGTSWTMSLTFDESGVRSVRQIPGYNATFNVALTSSRYTLGGRANSLDELWITAFDNSVGGGDELNFYGDFGGRDHLVVALGDSSGRAVSGLGRPDFRALKTTDFGTRFVSFNEVSPLVSGIAGGSYRQGTVDSLTVTAVPAPASLPLLVAGLAFMGVFFKRRGPTTGAV
jgi:hypothetical protein